MPVSLGKRKADVEDMLMDAPSDTQEAEDGKTGAYFLFLKL
jgi:hypothetical protein